MQQIFLGLGAVSEKTYVDDVFSTLVYKGDSTQSPQVRNNGIDLAGEGGLVWAKRRNGGHEHGLYDTARGVEKRLSSDAESAEETASTGVLSFTSTGFTTAQADDIGGNGDTYASWTFRKAKGFFDVVTYTGNGTTGQYISHNLGCIPGCIIIKNRSSSTGWQVYHVSSELADEHSQGHGSDDYELMLQSTSAASQQTAFMSTSSAPTATSFHLNKDSWLNNKVGQTYVAYVFAAGRSTDATARCTQFDGSDDQLNIPDSTDWDLGNGDFTLETWIKSTQPTNSYKTALGQWTTHTSPDYGWAIRYSSIDIGNGWSFFYSTTGSNYITTLGSDIGDGKWHHIAVTRTGGNLRTFTDGVLNTTRSTTDTFNNSGTTMKIGGQGSSGNYFNGQLSNVRLVKGTALYTSSFTPPTEPLTNVTNTKLLCCNNLSVTGSTVTPGTITKSSGPVSIPDSPFKDSAAEKFGADGKNIVHCGSYVGTGNTVQTINLGWEPQWILVKDTTSASNWGLYDSMRGLTNIDINDAGLYTNSVAAEVQNNYFSITPFGFKIVSNNNEVNKVNGRFIFMAIRRPDGYVGKPPALGSSVFTQAYGASSGDFRFTSNFPVDFAWAKLHSSTGNWWTSARLIQGKELKTNLNDAAATGTNKQFDSNVSWHAPSPDSTYISHMWKRHAGFDVVCYRTNENISTGVQMIPHSMNAVPEMYWIKALTSGGTNDQWAVYHKGLNGGTNPDQYYLWLNSTNAEASSQYYFGAAPTATDFAVSRNNGRTGDHDQKYIAMLFASANDADGNPISKVDGYDGDTNAQDKTISCGFQPRFVIAKCSTVGGSYNHWFVFDSVRGAGSGNDKTLRLDVNEAQTTNSDIIEFNSNGFIVKAGYQLNEGSRKYIYYAHS